MRKQTTETASEWDTVGHRIRDRMQDMVQYILEEENTGFLERAKSMTIWIAVSMMLSVILLTGCSDEAAPPPVESLPPSPIATPSPVLTATAAATPSSVPVATLTPTHLPTVTPAPTEPATSLGGLLRYIPLTTDGGYWPFVYLNDYERMREAHGIHAPGKECQWRGYRGVPDQNIQRNRDIWRTLAQRI